MDSRDYWSIEEPLYAGTPSSWGRDGGGTGTATSAAQHDKGQAWLWARAGVEGARDLLLDVVDTLLGIEYEEDDLLPTTAGDLDGSSSAGSSSTSSTAGSRGGGAGSSSDDESPASAEARRWAQQQQQHYNHHYRDHYHHLHHNQQQQHQPAGVVGALLSVLPRQGRRAICWLQGGLAPYADEEMGGGGGFDLPPRTPGVARAPSKPCAPAGTALLGHQ
jgi:hypothetical protein